MMVIQGTNTPLPSNSGCQGWTDSSDKAGPRLILRKLVSYLFSPLAGADSTLAAFNFMQHHKADYPAACYRHSRPLVPEGGDLDDNYV